MRTLTDEQKNKIIELYVNQKRGQAYVCKQTNVSVNELKRFLKENGYHIRNFSEAAIASNKNRESYKNRDYFKTESSNMAWILGFLASDGTIKKNENEIKIGLSIVDKEILEKIRQELQLQTSVKEYVTNMGTEACKLQWTCQEHKQDLAKYNIIPAKTFILKPPLELKGQYWIDYIRGYFDGDGSVNYIKSNNSLRWQICSATKEIIEWIVNFLYEEYNIPKVTIQEWPRKEHILYAAQYSTDSTKKIHDILYTPGSLYLDRKKKKFDEIINMK